MSRPMLAATGIVFVLVVVAVIIYLIYRHMKSGRGSNNPVPSGTPEERLAVLRKIYDESYRSCEVPNSAMHVSFACNSYVPEGALVKHYCWMKDGLMMLFPTWESMAAAPDIRPRRWRIPVADIICFAMEQGLPDRFVVLQFKKESGIMTLAFSEDAARVFAMLLPDKDFSRLLEEFYPKSSRNIRDIKESFLSLKELRQEDLITEDEYVAKKKEMLILM